MGTFSGAAVNVRGGGFESVANILEREVPAVTKDWFSRVELESDLRSIPMNFEERTGHLPQLLRDVVARLRLNEGSRASVSEAASIHGGLRRTQGYTAAMAVQESRLLQVAIFSMLHRNVMCLDFNRLLPDIAIIADEVDAQLTQQVLRFTAVRPASLQCNPLVRYRWRDQGIKNFLEQWVLRSHLAAQGAPRDLCGSLSALS
jgi:hypothetical protein